MPVSAVDRAEEEAGEQVGSSGKHETQVHRALISGAPAGLWALGMCPTIPTPGTSHVSEVKIQ